MGNKKNKNKIGCPEVSKFKLSGLKGAEARWGRHNNPKGGGMARPMPKESKVKVSKVKNKQVYLPENLQTKEFETTWDNWQQYRKEKRASPERRCMMECEALNKANKRIEGLDKELHRWELQATNEAIDNERLRAELAAANELLGKCEHAQKEVGKSPDGQFSAYVCGVEREHAKLQAELDMATDMYPAHMLMVSRAMVNP